MISPGTLNLTAQRWSPFFHSIAFVGYDFTAGVFAAHFRLLRDAAGDPLIALANAAEGSQGMSLIVTTDDDDVPTSVLTLQIDEATLEPLLLNAGKAGEDRSIVWDLHITGVDLPKARWLQGSFIIAAGSTQ